MFIECLIKRESGTIVTINGFRYKFEEAKDGALICNVMSPEHQNWFLRMPAFYQKYEPKHIDKKNNDGVETEDAIEENDEEEVVNLPIGNLPPPQPSSGYNYSTKEDLKNHILGLKINDLRKTAKDHGIQVPFNAKKEDLQDTLLRMIS